LVELFPCHALISATFAHGHIRLYSESQRGGSTREAQSTPRRRGRGEILVWVMRARALESRA
jgi:hypothetical protein